MKKIKLPRKRKKAFIKEKGSTGYMACVIAGEFLQEEGLKNAHKFPRVMKHFRAIQYW